MSIRKIEPNIFMHCDVYVTIDIRVMNAIDEEKKWVLGKAKEYLEISKKYNGEQYNLPNLTPAKVGELEFYVTYVFENSNLANQYLTEISK